jgi:hypothetical protein
MVAFARRRSRLRRFQDMWKDNVNGIGFETRTPVLRKELKWVIGVVFKHYTIMGSSTAHDYGLR